MRKVIYQVYKYSLVEGKQVGNWSEPESGYFHCWGTEIIDSAENICQYTVAIIEDVNLGICYKVDPTKMRFVTPPETRNHSKG
jgi:hypothetical protein